MNRREFLITALGGATALAIDPIKAAVTTPATGLSLDEAMLAIGNNFVQRIGWGTKHIVALEHYYVNPQRSHEHLDPVEQQLTTKIEIREGSARLQIDESRIPTRIPEELAGLTRSELIQHLSTETKFSLIAPESRASALSDEDRTSKDWRILTREELAAIDPEFAKQERIAKETKDRWKLYGKAMRGECEFPRQPAKQESQDISEYQKALNAEVRRQREWAENNSMQIAAEGPALNAEPAQQNWHRIKLNDDPNDWPCDFISEDPAALKEFSKLANKNNG